MADEPDSIVRKTVSLPASLWARIEDFQFANRFKREVEAIRRLIELGLAKDASLPPDEAPAPAQVRRKPQLPAP